MARRQRNGAPGDATARLLARGEGWAVTDLVCTCGPQDRSFEERQPDFCIAIVTAGSFQYRSAAGRAVMTPGSLLLGNAEQGFECGHEHGTGDRCLSFAYAPDYFERLTADAVARGAGLDFRLLRLPPVRALSPIVARALAGLAASEEAPWEEFGVQLAAQTLQVAADGRLREQGDAPPAVVARVTRTVRMIERHADGGLTLGSLAREAGLSPYHFLRTFERLTGVTPHQYIRRARLREAAMRLTTRSAKVLDVAFDCGFGDVSNFNHAFRTEFGVSPRVYRRKAKSEGADYSADLA